MVSGDPLAPIRIRSEELTVSSVREGFRRLGIVVLGTAEAAWLVLVLALVLGEEAWEGGVEALLVAAGGWIVGGILIWLAGRGVGKVIEWVWDGFEDK